MLISFFRRLDVANLKYNVSKCAFAQEEVVILGQKVLKHSKNLNPTMLQGISDLRPPTDVSRSKNLKSLTFIKS